MAKYRENKKKEKSKKYKERKWLEEAVETTNIMD